MAVVVRTVLLLLAVTRGLLEGLDDHGGRRGHDSGRRLTVITDGIGCEALVVVSGGVVGGFNGGWRVHKARDSTECDGPHKAR